MPLPLSEGALRAARFCALALTCLLSGCSRGAPPETAPAPAAAAEVPEPWESIDEVDTGFRPIRLADCDVFYGKGERQGATWTQDGPILRCTGRPRGYLYTKERYRNFTLRCDFRFVPTDSLSAEKRALCNTGFLMYVTEPHKQWPVSLEVQGRFDQMAAIKANGGAADPELLLHDEAAREQARRPVGEWNTIEIVSRDGALTADLNGTPICRSAPSELVDGVIGLQSEDFAVEFRNLRIREDQATADQPTEQ